MQRNRTNIAQYMKDVQTHESEKLVLVASKHMDLIGSNFPALVQHMGITQPSSNEDGGSSYTSEKISRCQQLIASALENIQMEKCEELEHDESEI